MYGEVQEPMAQGMQSQRYRGLHSGQRRKVSHLQTVLGQNSEQGFGVVKKWTGLA
jgi:hypothetical protein